MNASVCAFPNIYASKGLSVFSLSLFQHSSYVLICVRLLFPDVRKITMMKATMSVEPRSTVKLKGLLLEQITRACVI